MSFELIAKLLILLFYLFIGTPSCQAKPVVGNRGEFLYKHRDNFAKENFWQYLFFTPYTTLWSREQFVYLWNRQNAGFGSDAWKSKKNPRLKFDLLYYAKNVSWCIQYAAYYSFCWRGGTFPKNNSGLLIFQSIRSHYWQIYMKLLATF